MPRKGQHISTRARLKAPDSLSPGARRVFEHVVKSVDPTHFSAVDLPLLCEYATACHQAELAGRELAKTGAVVAGKASPWLGAQEKAVRSMVALSARLRVAPQTRFDRLVAGANARPQPKPLEDEDDDDGLLARPL